MTRPLAVTQRQLLEQIAADVRESVIDKATQHILLSRIASLERENEVLRGIIGRVTIARQLRSAEHWENNHDHRTIHGGTY